MKAELGEVSPAFRPLRESDLDFIYPSWLESYRDGWIRHVTPPMEPATYFAGQRRVIAELLARPTTRYLAAVTPDYDEAILGWAVAEPPQVLHYVYVKDTFRHLGLARALLDRLGLAPQSLIYTHVTRRGLELLREMPRYLSHFNPYLLLRS